MEYSESILVDFYTWCFSVSPDVIAANSASSSDGTNVVSIIYNTTPDTSPVWVVSAQSAIYNIASFEVDLSTCIENFKQAWTNKDNQV